MTKFHKLILPVDTKSLDDAIYGMERAHGAIRAVRCLVENGRDDNEFGELTGSDFGWLLELIESALSDAKDKAVLVADPSDRVRAATKAA